MMKTGLACACLLICIDTGFSCNMNQVQTTATTCLTAMSMSLQGGDACGAWSTYECCLKDAFSAAGCETSQADSMLTATRSTNTALSGCASSTCSGSSTGGSTDEAGAGGSSGSEGSSSSGNSVCDLSAAQATSNTCLTAMTQGLAGGDTCSAWSTYECCLKDGYLAAGCETSQADSMLSTTKSIQPALANCASPTCSGSSSGGNSQPSEVTTTLTGHVHYPADYDPTTFDINTYIEATQAALGVSTAPEAVLKAWEILVSYLVPAGADMAALKTAIASANSIEESAVALTITSRRLGLGRRLNTQSGALNAQVDAKITVPDAAKANSVKTSAASVDSLTTALGGAVTVKAGSEPAAAAVIETTVKSEPSKAGDLQNLISNAGPAVGGTITAEVSTSNSGSDVPSTSSSSVCSSSIMLATLVLLRMIM